MEQTEDWIAARALAFNELALNFGEIADKEVRDLTITMMQRLIDNIPTFRPKAGELVLLPTTKKD